MEDNTKKTNLVIIIGLAGAGRSVAIKSLEDLGFSCIDLLPIDLLMGTCKYLSQDQSKNYCIGLDIKDELSLKKLKEYKTELSSLFKVDVVYLWANEEVLLTRFIETRRKHPILDTSGDLLSAIRTQKKYFSTGLDVTDVRFDTSFWSPHYLARIMEERYASFGVRRHLYISVTSFGFKHGILNPADNIFDVRFLANPYFVEELKEKTGLDTEVQEYIKKDERYSKFMDIVENLYSLLIPSYYTEGKNFLRIGVGCTGGKHRSVCIAEDLATRLSKINQPDVLISVNHRDLSYNQDS